MAERSYDFLMPSVNFFGPGVINKIGDRAKTLGMKKPVIVTDKFLEGLEGGAVQQTLASLKAAGVDYVVYNNVEPNPKIRNIKEVKKLYEKSGADSIITVGGGSAHDTGKGAGIILTNGDDITKLAGIETLDKALPPLIAVNTTAGTGSELTRHAVITNEETHLKFVVEQCCCIVTVPYLRGKFRIVYILTNDSCYLLQYCSILLNGNLIL